MTASISVVMAVYNGLRFLPAQIDSVLSQLEGDDELVIVDDASTDNSANWLRTLGSPRIRLHINAVNAGVRLSFDRGLGLARNDLIFLCDQDDVWLPGKRAAMVNAFATHPRAVVVVSDAEIIDGDGRVTAPSFMATRGGFKGSLAATLWRNRFLGCAMAIRRSLLAVALPIPPESPMHDMWLGALGTLRGQVVYLPQPLLQYRRHGSNASPSRPQPLGRMLRWRLDLALALGKRLLGTVHRRSVP